MKAQEIAQVHNEALSAEQSYVQWRDHILNAREDMNAVVTPRGNSLQLNLSGITPRGPELTTPRGYLIILLYISQNN